MEYGFICKCGHKFDLEMKVLEYQLKKDSIKCPKCKKIASRRWDSMSWTPCEGMYKNDN